MSDTDYPASLFSHIDSHTSVSLPPSFFDNDTLLLEPALKRKRIQARTSPSFTCSKYKDNATSEHNPQPQPLTLSSASCIVYLEVDRILFRDPHSCTLDVLKPRTSTHHDQPQQLYSTDILHRRLQHTVHHITSSLIHTIHGCLRGA